MHRHYYLYTVHRCPMNQRKSELALADLNDEPTVNVDRKRVLSKIIYIEQQKAATYIAGNILDTCTTMIQSKTN